MDETLSQRLYTFLLSHNVLTLAYHDGTTPGACALWFAADRELQFFFLSSLNTRHGRALAEGSTVAFTIHKDEQDWRTIQGVQGRGYCSLVPAKEHKRAWQSYTDRFPFIKQQFSAISAALSRTSLWSIRPTWLRLIDNSVAFGHKEELLLNREALDTSPMY